MAETPDDAARERGGPQLKELKAFLMAMTSRASVRARRLVLGVALLLLAPSVQHQALAQAANWAVTILEATSEGETVCSNASTTITVPGPIGSAQGALCGVTATLTVQTQNVMLELTGSREYQGCLWNITTPIRGIGFISGNAVPATGMRGTAQSRCEGGTFTNQVSARFQAQRVVAAGGAQVTGFTGAVQVTVPGQAPFNLTAQNSAGLTLQAGTRIQVGPGSTLTMQFPDGSVRLSENTPMVIASMRFFLLAPSFHPLRGTFATITWSCIPTAEGCASLATPNTRLAFLPPIGSRGNLEPRDGEETVTFTVAYTQTGGLGTSVVSVQAGRLRVQDFRGSSTVLSVGQESRVANLAAGAAPLDLNGDTAPDLFRYSATTGEWTQELSAGAAPITGTWSPDWTVAPGDFDGDGLTDFLLSNGTSGAVRVALNAGNGGFTEITGSLSSSNGWRAYVANLNGDRLSDVLLHQSSSGQWIQAINQGAGTFQTSGGQWSSGWDPRLLDLNGDDKADLLLFNAATARWQWALNSGSGGFTAPASGESAGATHIHAGDFTADGRWDALFYNSRTGAWSLATNTGSGFSVAGGTTAAGREIFVGDLDADGDADAFLYDSGSGQWSTLTSDGTRLTTGATGSWAARWRVSPAEFNTDGRTDFLLYSPEGGVWAKAVNTGTGSFTLEEGVWAAGLTVISSQTLTQGLLPNDIVTTSCAGEPNLASTRDGAARSIDFVNASGRMRRVYWLDRYGRRVLYRTLESGRRYVQASSGGDVWVVTDGAGRCEGVYLAGDIPSRAVLK